MDVLTPTLFELDGVILAHLHPTGRDSPLYASQGLEEQGTQTSPNTSTSSEAFQDSAETSSSQASSQAPPVQSVRPFSARFNTLSGPTLSPEHWSPRAVEQRIQEIRTQSDRTVQAHFDPYSDHQVPNKNIIVIEDEDSQTGLDTHFWEPFNNSEEDREDFGEGEENIQNLLNPSDWRAQVTSPF